ncbi:MAG: peptide deformylase [Deltaproteobacteria bacterium]|nr:peptide deformylase [Deltaproteobacteria bacterium]
MSNTLKIYRFPDTVLRTKARPVENIDGKLQKFIDDMTETMYRAPGIGLAAIQVGEPISLVVYDISPPEEGHKINVIMNPEIVSREGTVTYEEACLSVFDYSAEVTRSNKILVKAIDREGKPIEIEAEGLHAVCLQHEIDHLNGLLFIDHISTLKRSLYKNRLKKILNKEEQPE